VAVVFDDRAAFEVRVPVLVIGRRSRGRIAGAGTAVIT